MSKKVLLPCGGGAMGRFAAKELLDKGYCVDKEIKEKKNELKLSEERLIQRENSIDKRDELFQKRELALDEREY